MVRALGSRTVQQTGELADGLTDGAGALLPAADGEPENRVLICGGESQRHRWGLRKAAGISRWGLRKAAALPDSRKAANGWWHEPRSVKSSGAGPGRLRGGRLDRDRL